MKMKWSIFLVALLGVALSPSMPSAAPVSDLNVIRDEIRSICARKYEGEEEGRQRRFCESDDVDLRLLMGMQQIETGRTHIDIKPAPATIAGSGAINEIVYVALTLNGICRGSGGDDSLQMSICEVRDHLFGVLTRRGYCYGKKGQIGAEMAWHKCTAQSLR